MDNKQITNWFANLITMLFALFIAAIIITLCAYPLGLIIGSFFKLFVTGFNAW